MHKTTVYLIRHSEQLKINGIKNIEEDDQISNEKIILSVLVLNSLFIAIILFYTKPSYIQSTVCCMVKCYFKIFLFIIILPFSS